MKPKKPPYSWTPGKCRDCSEPVTHGVMYCNKHLKKWYGPLETAQENARRKAQNNWTPTNWEYFRLDKPIYLTDIVRVVTDLDQFILERSKGDGRWRRVAYCRSRAGLMHSVRVKCPEVPKDAVTQLSDLPEWIEVGLVGPAPTLRKGKWVYETHSTA